jgi:uncharacterized protein YbjT (DUF2867 family)
MHVLVIGAGGFIGRHVVGGLLGEGVRLTVAGRLPERLARLWPGTAAIACDLSRDDSAIWEQRLAGIDAVVNCAGLMGDGADYAGVHDRGARALFDACLSTGVGRVIQLSALGADAGAVTAYHRSKAKADDHLAALDPDGRRLGWAILRPSLVLGQGGRSTSLLTALAALPLLPRLGKGQWQVQPIAIEDLTEAVLRLLKRPGTLALRLDAVGSEPVTTDDLFLALRRWLGLGRAPWLSLPSAMLRMIARLGIGPVTREGLAMLEAGNVAPAAPFVAVLGFRPMTVEEVLARHPANAANRIEAKLLPIEPILRGLLAFLWLAGGIVSLAFAPANVVAGWLAKVGLTGLPATAMLWAGSLADIAMGLALLARLRGAALAGIGLMVAYSAILTIVAPELWADPFGSLVKNAAVLGLSLTVHAMEARRG